ncbi:DUF6603 domain-containing protein [Streptomyces sp. NPDC048254]|uniref:DUF6603 domain-containing protein n=1 Tax=Streptomyces sp. NPDC048254 TaxID=3365525 RepID=UPI0037167A1E
MNELTLARYVESFLRPLTAAVDDPGRESALLAMLGYTPPAGVSYLGVLKPLVGKFADTANTLAGGADATKLVGDLIDAITAIADLAGNLASHLPGGAAGSPLVTGTDFLETLPRKLFDLLLIDFLAREAPTVLGVLRVLSVVRTRPVAAGADPLRTNHVTREVAWEQLPKLLTDPLSELKQYYGWGTADGLDIPVLFESLRILAAAIGTRSDYRAIQPGPRQLLDQAFGTAGRVSRQDDTIALRLPLLPLPHVAAGLDVYPVEVLPAATPPVVGGLALDAFVDAQATLTLQLSDTVRLDIRLGGHTDGFGLLLRPGAPVIVLTPDGAGNVAIDAGLGITYAATSGAPLVLFGSERGTRLQVESIAAQVGVVKEPSVDDVDVRVGASIAKAAVVIRSADGDGFLAKVLPKDGIRLEFDFELGYSLRSGVSLGASAGVELTLATNIDLLGVLKIDAVYLALRAATADGQTRISLAVSALTKLTIGPLSATIEKLGIQAVLQSAEAGNLGPMDLGVAFKPPNGIGLALKSGPVKGGGYLFIDPEAGQYAGMLQLEFSAIAIKAIGLLATKLPNGRQGFSLLILITVEFTPIQLGFGFTLIGVGGLIGIHRDMLLGPLRDGIKHHTLDSILFPKDPVANATKIIGDLDAVFPPAEGRFTFGLMAKLGWGSPVVITAEIGIVLVLPSPVRLALMGKIRLNLPEDNEDAVVKLNLDILGTLDFAKSELGIDAVIYDSRIAVFGVSGGMALRINWGARPVFVMSIGGFHPRFPVPPDFPALDRLAISLATSENPRIRLESYLAVTANSVQIGAKLDLYAETKFLGTWSVSAFLGFDALIYLNPFHFTVDLFGGAALKHNGHPFLSLDVLLSIAGPGQWLVHGQATFDFFGRHSVAVDLVIGEPEPAEPLPVVNPLDDLKAALEDPRSWSAQLPDTGQMLVTLREIDAPGLVLVHPFGRLTVREKVVPLDTTITHYGASDPGPHRRFTIGAVRLGTKVVDRGSVVRERFSRGQFFDLTEDQKIAGPEFEPLPAGLTGIGIEAVTWGTATVVTFDYETLVVDAIQPAPVRPPGPARYTPGDQVVLTLAGTGAASRALTRRDNPAEYAGAPKGIAVHDVGHTIRSVADLSKAVGSTTYGSRTEAEEALGRRADRAGLQLAGAHEEGG